jgi:glyoxylase-like metal-dependent hydrolase (beta-lactamase superfamily II)
MEITELLPGRLHLLRFAIGQAYLWTDPDAFTLIDAGVAEQGPAIAALATGLGYRPDQLARIVLTHGHEDHFGSAGWLRDWSGAPVLAHPADVPIVRGETRRPDPVLTPAERPLWENVPPVPPAPPTAVDEQVHDGQRLDFGGGAVVLSVPGHTRGSIAVHLPEHGVLFTGDTVAAHAGRPVLGVFNTDRDQLIASVRRLAGLAAELACFGHGDPYRGRVSAALRKAAQVASS